jgi:glyoxylase-like metal-dependent hydrolase (beta-lactamase superfamily II)
VDELEVMFTPGHSPGSVSFLSRAQGFVISGDVIFREGVGRTDLPGGNFTILSDTIIRELYTLPDETIVHSGHGPATTIGWEKSHNSFVRMPG